MSRRKTVLFVGEAVSLAHVTRPLVLAQSLSPERYDIHFACDGRYQSLLRLPAHIRFWPIRSSQGDRFTRGADRGGFVWQLQEIESSVREELVLFDQVRPDLIVVDLRFSVSVSAELAKIPFATLTNVHWSPYRLLGFPPVPPWPFSVRLRQKVAKLLEPLRPNGVTAAINRVRQAHRLPLLKDYLDLATHGNYTFYVEPPGLIPTAPLPDTHYFLGPVLWSPHVPMPEWWQRWDRGRPLIYVTLGSTGVARRLPDIVRVLQQLPATIAVATAGRAHLQPTSEDVFVADYLPGMEVCRLAAGVVCNGGSATAYQALSQGAPVVGVWSNLDQYLTMTTIERAGAGLSSRASNHDAEMILDRVSTLLKDPRYRAAAVMLSEAFGTRSATEAFPRIVGSLREVAGVV